MLNFTQTDLKTTAEKALELHPDPVPRFRLLRDVLGLDPTTATYRAAESDVTWAKWVALLQNSQCADGTWGRFHTRDSCRKSLFPTTEIAIAVALDSGIDKQSPMLQKTLGTLVDYVNGQTSWPDPPEKHDNPLAWYVWMKHLSAAVLSLIDKHHPCLDEFWQVWVEVIEAAFHTGIYDRQHEIAALNCLLKCRMKNPVPFHTKYPLLILSATAHQLPARLERRLLDFVMHSPAGIYYVCGNEINTLPLLHAKNFWPWFQAHRLLARFPLWRELSADAVNWIWAQRRADGFWDLGRTIGRKPYTSFPLSESWRRPENRVIDCTVAMLDLLSRSFDRA